MTDTPINLTEYRASDPKRWKKMVGEPSVEQPLRETPKGRRIESAIYAVCCTVCSLRLEIRKGASLQLALSALERIHRDLEKVGDKAAKLRKKYRKTKRKLERVAS